MIRLLMVDNYDSFTYNLVHLFRDLGAQVEVVKNDKIPFEDLEEFDGIVLSPGPGIPEEAGDLLKLIRCIRGKVPLLGICLGHQALGLVYDHEMICLTDVYHGIATPIVIEKKTSSLFEGVPDNFQAARYHSWVIGEKSQSELIVTARDGQGMIMAIEHNNLPVYGLQFHPESILTQEGKTILQNFLKVITTKITSAV